MKIRVMSKLGHASPYRIPQGEQREKTQRRTLNHPSTHSAASLAPASQYFPTAALPQQRLKGTKQTVIKDFFNRFETNCKIQYERVERDLLPVCRRLAPILAQRQCTLSTTQCSDEYQFSFKKVQDTPNIIRNNTQIPTPLSSFSRAGYFLQASNRPKIKLRKFHSLIAIKANSCLESIPQQGIQTGTRRDQTGMRRNQSMAKRGVIGLMEAGRERHLTENEEEVARQKDRCTYEDFQEEKERLNRIREQLNQIYHAKRGTQRGSFNTLSNHF